MGKNITFNFCIVFINDGREMNVQNDENSIPYQMQNAKLNLNANNHNNYHIYHRNVYARFIFDACN